jgi:hypothetical protein
VIYSLIVQDGQLFARYGRVGAKLLRPAVNDIFRLDNNTLHFEKDEADRTTGFILNASRVRGLRFERESGI